MKDIAIYFTPEEYETYRNGDRAIGYNREQMRIMHAFETIGFDCQSQTAPLTQMTKVRPECLRDIEWSLIGMYVERLNGKRRKGAVNQ